VSQRQMRTFTPRAQTHKHTDNCSRVGP
jgi:hypothetical protein